MNYWVWTLLSFSIKLIVKENVCQWNHEDIVMIKDHDIGYLVWIMLYFQMIVVEQYV